MTRLNPKQIECLIDLKEGVLLRENTIKPFKGMSGKMHHPKTVISIIKLGVAQNKRSPEDDLLCVKAIAGHEIFEALNFVGHKVCYLHNGCFITNVPCTGLAISNDNSIYLQLTNDEGNFLIHFNFISEFKPHEIKPPTKNHLTIENFNYKLYK